MSSERRTARMARACSLVAPAGALLAGAIALVDLALRWQARNAAGPPAVVMVPATALGVLLAAGSLFLVHSSGSAAWRRVGRIAGAASAAVGLLSLGQYVAEWQAGVTHAGLLGLGEHWWTQRPSPVTSAGLLFIGTSSSALLAHRFRRWADIGASATLIVALAGLIGHAYGASTLYGLNQWGGTAISTASALGAIALGVVFADPSRGVAAAVVSGSPGGHLLRRLLPVALVAPPSIGALTLAAQKAGWIDQAFGTALLVVCVIVLITGFVIRQARAVHGIHEQREKLLAREREVSQRVTKILESITDAFVAVDRSWRFTYVNREAERLLSRPREELLGRELWQEFPETVGGISQQQYQRAMNEQRTVQFEGHYAPLARWFDVRAYPSSHGLSIYFQDVTARKRAEEQLRESEERFRALANSLPQLAWVADPSGWIHWYNERWHEYTGTTPQEVEGWNWRKVQHPDHVDRVVAKIRAAFDSGQPWEDTFPLRSKTGEYRWFLSRAVPLRGAAGKVVRWLGTNTDITEQLQAAAERERLLGLEQEARAEADRRRVELERVTESRANLIRGFSHDVRTPLGVVDVQAYLLEDGRHCGPLNEKQRQSVQRIRRSIRISLRLIDDLLELARAEAGEIELSQQETDLGQLAREVVEDFQAHAVNVGFVLEVRAPDGLRIPTDPVRVRQVLANLVSNAVKYAPHGRVIVDAAVREPGAPRRGEWMALSVIDNGPGIPQDKLEQIFQEFTRLEPQVKQGLGIGLAISRRIARLLGGDLTVESEVGRGSTFTLWLPASQETAPQAGQPSGADEVPTNA